MAEQPEGGAVGALAVFEQLRSFRLVTEPEIFGRAIKESRRCCKRFGPTRSGCHRPARWWVSVKAARED